MEEGEESSVFSFQFSVFGFRFSVFGFRFSVFGEVNFRVVRLFRGWGNSKVIFEQEETEVTESFRYSIVGRWATKTTVKIPE